ncbi:MAG: DUF4253 domain-containing protein [Chromatiales bacterium]|jgi:hypothetical protein
MEFINSDAESALKAALNSVGKNSRVVICGDPDEEEILQEQIKSSTQSVSDMIKLSSSIDASEWFQQRKKALIEEYDQHGEDFLSIEGVWSGQLYKHSILMHRDLLSGELGENVLLAKLDVDSSWQIPAYFKYGGWNDCPDTEVHCAVWKHWFKQYGAEIVSVSHDVFEAWVPRPPGDEKAAMSLAWEQFLYCGDIVYQGVESVANLAGTLLNGNSWYFWWD